MSSLRSMAILGLVIAFVGLLGGCSHGEIRQRLDQKLSAETDIKTPADLAAEGAEAVDKAPDLSAEQKAQLHKVGAETRARLGELAKQSVKLQSILVRDLATEPYNEVEAELIKTRLSKIEDQRLDAIFGAVDRANTILGRGVAQHRVIVEGLIDLHDHDHAGKHEKAGK